MISAIRKHVVDFGMIVGLVIVAAAVGGYILGQQRFHLPGWVPFVGTDFTTLRGEFETAKSVTPGQGQTVTIAGVNVGEISRVDLEDGRAVVEMRIKRELENTEVYRDASMLLRPKTGLEDMVVQLDPGTPAAGRVPDGYTVPVERTRPTVQFDEILAALDADTRDFLKLLVGAGGEGLDGQGRALSATLRRFEPGARDLRRLTGALVERRRNIRRVMHNFRLLAEALGEKDDQLAELVDSSNAVFRVFAREERNLRSTLAQLPGTLDTTRETLGKVDRLGRTLGPTLEDLRPTARALGPTQRRLRPFLRETTPVIRDQLRPFARDVLPVVRTLRPAARDLASVTPDLRTTLDVLNRLVNTLAYNPPGKAEEGYLFWAAWANHLGPTLFGTQDAHGPVRRGLFVTSCSSLGVLETITRANPLLGTLTTLLNVPQREQVCPESTQAPDTTAPGAR